jgi:hypothetical protein
MQTVKVNTPIAIPASVAICPICKAAATMEIDKWEQNKDGTWQAGECGVHLSCSTEPDVHSNVRRWREWHNWHFRMPYVDWLPVERTVYKWLVQNYRFEGL